ncbi:unnamed protein product [Chrysoparadoxa australica]
MAGQVPLEESNVALINSDLAKEVRAAAAEFEAEFDGAGAGPGIEVWRSENLGIKRWPKDDYGSFFQGDSYIVLHTYKEGDSDALRHNVHFWLGTDTSQDEAGVAAYKTVELDDKLGQLPVQYREVQGYESAEFLELFPPAMIIMQGGIDSGFNHVEPTEYKPRLLQCKGLRKKVRVVEVPLALSSLNNGDVFVLDNGLQLWQWNGTEAGVFEKRQANEIIAAVKSDRKGKPSTQILDGEEECDEFWALLGGMGEIASAEAGGPDDVEGGEKKLLKLSDESGSLELSEVASGDSVSKDLLDTNDVFLLDDRGLALFVWVGDGASKDERAQAFQHANEYITKTGLSWGTPVSRVTESGTSKAFENCFL